MPPLTEAERRAYLLEDSDTLTAPHYPKRVQAFEGRVTSLIDGWDYFGDLYDAINALGSGSAADIAQQGIYLVNWTLDAAFELKKPLLGKRLIDLLAEKAAAGVDVRVLIWVNDFMFAPSLFGQPLPDMVDAQTLPFAGVLLGNLDSIYHLRQRAALADRVLVNTLDAPLGGFHMKFALVFDKDRAIGYTGGIDLDESRYADDHHFFFARFDSGGTQKRNLWHDVMAKVEGPIVQEFFDHYADLWNELIRRKEDLSINPRFRHRVNGTLHLIQGVPDGATAILYRDMPAGSGPATQWVQSLRTVPLPQDFFIIREPEISFAPEGAYEIQLAVKKAIDKAQKYIYIEDQSMKSREVFSYLRQALQDPARPDLKVILVSGQPDPADPRDETRAVLIHAFLTLWLSTEQLQRLVFYVNTEATIHSKIFMVDDVIAIVGSAGMFNRSFVKEWEHSVAFVDKDGAEAVKQLRIDLWGEIFRLPKAERAQFADLDTALGVWHPAWVTTPPPYRLPLHARKISTSPALSDLYIGPWPYDGGWYQSAEADAIPSLMDDFLIPWPSADGVTQLVADNGPVFRLPNGTPVVQGGGGGPLETPIVGGAPFDPGNTIAHVERGEIQDDSLPSPDMPSFGHPKILIDLARANAVVIWAKPGTDVVETRLITRHESNVIEFEPFDEDPDPDTFSYVIQLPVIRPIVLPPSIPDLVDAIMGLFFNFIIADTGEIPSASGEAPPKSDVVIIVGDSSYTAVNKPVEIAFVSTRQGTISWAYNGGDGTPTSGQGDSFTIRFSQPGEKIVTVTLTPQGGAPELHEVQIYVREPSGVAWGSRYPASSSVTDLASPFRENVQAFLAALPASVNVNVITTLRPPERAYLMAMAWRIHNDGVDPKDIRLRLPGVEIEWMHYNASGNYDEAASRSAASAMVAAYNIGPTGAVYPSEHSTGLALDMAITFSGSFTMNDAAGNPVTVSSQSDLKAVGATYGVLRLGLSNHWSSTGH